MLCCVRTVERLPFGFKKVRFTVLVSLFEAIQKDAPLMKIEMTPSWLGFLQIHSIESRGPPCKGFEIF